MHSIEDVRAYATNLRSIIREVGVNSGDMEKGVIRFEANISIRPFGSTTLGKRVEIKNLNSFRAMERGVSANPVDGVREGGTGYEYCTKVPSD